MHGGQVLTREDCPLVDLVLEDVEIVGGRYSDDVLMWVPRSVKDLLAEVEAIYADLIFTTLATYTHLEDNRQDTEAQRCEFAQYLWH